MLVGEAPINGECEEQLVLGRIKVVIMKMRKMLFGIIALLALAGLACSRSGRILTVEQATEEARPTALPTIDPALVGGADSIELGTEATLIGRQLLVNLFDGPGGAIIAGEGRGSTVTIQQSVVTAEGIWYQIESSSGQNGWVPAANLESNEVPGGLAVGDTFVITGRVLLVNLLEEPKTIGRIIGGVARGEVVTVVQVTQVDGVFWYQVDTTSGMGWVAEENVEKEEGAE